MEAKTFQVQIVPRYQVLRMGVIARQAQLILQNPGAKMKAQSLKKQAFN